MRAKKPAASGFQLVELVIVLAVVAAFAIVAIPPLLNASANLRVQLAAYELVGVLRAARAYAVLRSANVAVKFHPDPRRVTYSLYRDGDGDGVLNRDIASGVDREVAPPRPLVYFGSDVKLGFPPGVSPRDPADPNLRLDRLDDPIRFGDSDLASFSPLGESTPGSAYISDGRRCLTAVRVFGRTAKVRVLTYDVARERWR